MKSKQWDAIKTTVRTNIDLPKDKLLLTEKQWFKRGYVPKSEDAGEVMWTNQFCQISCRYLFEEEVESVILLLKEIERLKGQVQEFEVIGTIEEFKALKEKDTPYKPQEYEDRYYACKCDNILLPKWRKYSTELMPKSEGLPHCMACGQKLDWR